MKKIDFMKDSRALGVALGFLCIFFIILFFAWNTPAHRYGDSSTYFLEIVSIAKDYDIEYTEMDFNRIPDFHFDDLPAGMELIKNNQGKYFYGKEFTYALFASLFFKFGGIHSILVLNGLLFFLMILMGYLVLRETNDSPVSLIFSVLFFTLSTAVVYIVWIHPEIYSMFILMAALFFMYLYYRKSEVSFLVIAGTLFGIAGIARLWNFCFFIPFFLFGLYRTQWKRSLILGLSFLIPILLIIGSFYTLTGSLSFYGGERYYYLHSPYPFEESSDISVEPGFEFNLVDTIVSNTGNSILTGENIPYILKVYFIGRFTGMFWYYPFTLFALVSLLFIFLLAFRDRNESTGSTTDYFKILVVLGIISAILFIFLLRYQGNYFGGKHAVGNRYFTIYPAFLFLVGKIDPRKLFVFTIIAAILVCPVICNPVMTSQDPSLHAGKFPYTYFPFEYQATGLLPLKYVYYTPQLWIIQLPGAEKTIDEFYRIETSTQLFFVSRSPLSNITFYVYSETPAHVLLSSKHEMNDLDLDGNECTIGEITGLVPDHQAHYTTGNYWYYSAAVNPDTTIFLFPHYYYGGESTYNIHFIDWYPPEDRNQNATRWMENDGKIVVVRNETRPATLSYELVSFYRPRKVQIFGNENLIREEIVGSGFHRYEIPFDGDCSIIRFFSPEGSERPVDIPELHNNDTRNLSFAIRNVTVLENLPPYYLNFTGWYPPEESGRWMNTGATLTVTRDEDVPGTLSCELLSFHTSRTVGIAINGKPFQESEVGTDFSRFELPLDENISEIVFSTPDKPERPVDIPGLNSSDARNISIKIRNVSVRYQE